jgi:hypothetical protein
LGWPCWLDLVWPPGIHLIYRLVKAEAPAYALTALACWLWNPLVLIARAVGAHNDMRMLVLVLLGLRLAQLRRPAGALVTLLLAAHVKLTALLFLPAVLVWLARRHGWVRAAGAVLAVYALRRHGAFRRAPAERSLWRAGAPRPR